MKTSPYFTPTAIILIVLLTSFQTKNEQISYSNSDLELKEISFLEAVTRGIISCQSTGAGGFSGKSVVLNLVNKSVNPLHIKIIPGTLFYPNDDGQQTLITVEPQFISLAPKEKKKETISAYCSESHDRSPNTTTAFTFGKNKNPKFDSLFTFIQKMKIPSSANQPIVWAISDNSPVSAVGSETKELRNLRKFLYRLTGQEEEDFTSDYILAVDDRGFITKTLYQIKGFIQFNSDKTKWLHQEVYNENGKLKFKSMQAFEIPRGKSDYNFNILVKGWEKGNYTLKLKCGSEEVEKYLFKV